MRCFTLTAVIFLSTPSARRATGQGVDLTLQGVISIHALREEGDGGRSSMSKVARPISIHALREEGDPATSASHCSSKNFYPRPPRGGRLPGDDEYEKLKRFLSTPSARRATAVGPVHIEPFEFLSTPSARRATPHSGRYSGGHPISIHALREEGDSLPV